MPVSPLQIPTAPAIPAIEDELDPLNPQIPAPVAVTPAPETLTPAVPAAQPLSAIATPTRTDIDPSKDTVEGRVAGIISKGGPLQQLAETRSKQQVQQRGLLSTSMAVGAGQKALIESALPIAKADALYAQQINLQREKEGIDKRMLTASADEQIRLIAKKGELDTKLQEISGEQALTQISARGEIESGLIDRRGEIETQLQTADAENRSRLLKEQGNIDLELVKARGLEELSLRDRQAEIDSELTTLSASFKTADLATQQEHERVLNAERLALEERMLEIQGDQRLVLQKLQGEQAVELEDVRGFYDGQISTQKSSAVLYNTAQQIIAELLVNPDLAPVERTNAIQYQLDNLEASLSVLGTIGGVDISEILGTTPTTPTAPTAPTAPGETGDIPTITAGMSIEDRVKELEYAIVPGYGRDPRRYITGDINGVPFRIQFTSELRNLDPTRSAPHEDTDVFVPGIGWISKEQFNP